MALTVQGSLGINKAAYIKRAYFALRPQKYYDAFVSVASTDATAVGSSYTWNITADLAEAATPLAEQVDVTPVTPTDVPVTSTPLEFGNAVQLTALAEASAFMSYNPIIANLIGFNAGISVDAIARNKFQLGTNALFAKGTGSAVTARATLTSANTIDGRTIAVGVAKLRGLNAMPIGSSFIGLIHPDISVDLRGTTGAASWGDPHVYGAAGSQDDIWNGRVGTLAGATFIESPRAPLFLGGSPGTGAITTNAKTTSVSTLSDPVTGSVTITTTAAHAMSVGQGITFSGNGGVGLPANAVIVSVPSTTTFTIIQSGVSAGTPAVTVTSGSMSVYRTLIFGAEAFAKTINPGAGYGADPKIGATPVVDRLERFTGVYWKHLVDYVIFRNTALYSIESTSTIGLL
jgi:N4-gp56 family major capsid protein